MILGVIETFDKLKELHIKKNQDYTGKSSNPYFNFDVATELHMLFKDDWHKTYATMIGIKLGRIAALLNSGNTANHESVKDSFDDLIVYAAIWKSSINRTNLVAKNCHFNSNPNLSEEITLKDRTKCSYCDFYTGHAQSCPYNK